MNPLFEKTVYQNRREKLTQSVQHGIAVFLGNHEAPMNYPDNTYNFRQDSDFLYFFGLSIADIAAIIDFDAHKSIIFGNDFTIDDIIWMGDQPTIASLAERVGVTDTLSLDKLAEYIQKAQQEGRKVHFTPMYRGDNQIWLSNLTGINVNNIREAASLELIKGIVALRSAKEQCEIDEMDKACEIGVKMHTAAWQVSRSANWPVWLKASPFPMATAYPSRLSSHNTAKHCTTTFTTAFCKKAICC